MNDQAPEGSRKRIRFSWIAAAFVVLLAIGFAAAVVVYRGFVAYEPVAARHVPRDATFAARFDLTHVMFYEPFRRSVFPLADLGSSDRRERLEAAGIELGGEVREVVVALGAGREDWLIALGGPLSRREIAATLAEVLRSEGREVSERGGIWGVGSGLFFTQASDGALLFAASEPRLRSVLSPSAGPAPLGQGAGGLKVSSRWLQPPLSSLEGSYRAGSVILVQLSAESAGPPAAAEAALRRLLEQVGALDPVLSDVARNAVIRNENGSVTSELGLSNSAAETLAERVTGLRSSR
ncbi:MAG: hypothetical protein M3020_13250 [Myxococcota bacterium]|nr:hypothetical protein [Myxococcota bacterium]